MILATRWRIQRKEVVRDRAALLAFFCFLSKKEALQDLKRRARFFRIELVEVD